MTYTFFRGLENLMAQMLMTIVLAGAVVFVGGVIFGWEYAMLLAFVVLFGISLIQVVKR